jgi:hypothetical protein
MPSKPKVEVYAYLPPIQSAIMKSGDGDLMQVKFNINLLVSPDAVKIMLMTGKRLKLTVQEMTEKAIKTGKTNGQKEKSARKTANPVYNRTSD